MSKFVVHCKREPHDVYIGRPSKWGNPFSHLADTRALINVATRKESVEMYHAWLEGRLQQIIDIDPPSIQEIKAELKGKILGCWCAPQACHGDVLSKIANSEDV